MQSKLQEKKRSIGWRTIEVHQKLQSPAQIDIVLGRQRRSISWVATREAVDLLTACFLLDFSLLLRATHHMSSINCLLYLCSICSRYAHWLVVQIPSELIFFATGHKKRTLFQALFSWYVMQNIQHISASHLSRTSRLLIIDQVCACIAVASSYYWDTAYTCLLWHKTILPFS